MLLRDVARPLILVSNDDGVYARGIAVLAEVAAEHGDVVVSAPDGERSAQSHAITLHGHLRSREIRPGWFAVSGTPVDSVYLGSLHTCSRVPDLVLAGINHGFNLGTDVFYSGTVGAAREGRLRGASALAASVKGGEDPAILVPALHELIPILLERHRAGERHLINVNAAGPATQGGTMPIRVVPLGRRVYEDQVDERHDLQGRPYFWIGGPPAPTAKEMEGDIRAVSEGAVAVTPIELDITAPEIGQWRDLVNSRHDSGEARSAE